MSRPRTIALHELNADLRLLDLRAFVACAERHSYTKAAETLGQTRQNIKPKIEALQSALPGGHLFKVDGDGLTLTPHGQNLLPYALAMIDAWAALTRIAATGCSLAYLPQHAYFVAAAKKILLNAHLASPVIIEDVGLSEEHRRREAFEQEVLGPVAARAIDIAVGLPPAKQHDNLQSEVLYVARLEAMVNTAEDNREWLSLEGLAEKGNLLLAPAATRSHQMLDAAFRRYIPDQPLADITSMAHPGTKVLVSHGLQGLGTVVVPSDIAYPFQEGQMFGGPVSHDFKWVPIYRPDGTELTHEVVATFHRDRPNSNVPVVLNAIKTAVSNIGLDRRVAGS